MLKVSSRVHAYACLGEGQLVKLEVNEILRAISKWIRWRAWMERSSKLGAFTAVTEVMMSPGSKEARQSLEPSSPSRS